jgi:elongation factor Ts
VHRVQRQPQQRLAQRIRPVRQLDRDEVPEDVVAKERRIAEQITRDEGKPEQAIPKITEGRLNAFFKEIVLLEQPFIKDPKKSVKQVLTERKVNVTAFARYQIGQAG